MMISNICRAVLFFQLKIYLQFFISIETNVIEAEKHRLKRVSSASISKSDEPPQTKRMKSKIDEQKDANQQPGNKFLLQQTLTEFKHERHLKCR